MTSKKLRFRGDLNFQNRIDELLDETVVDGVSGVGPQRQSSGSAGSKDINNDATKATKERNVERG